MPCTGCQQMSWYWLVSVHPDSQALMRVEREAEAIVTKGSITANAPRPTSRCRARTPPMYSAPNTRMSMTIAVPWSPPRTTKPSESIEAIPIGMNTSFQSSSLSRLT